MRIKNNFLVISNHDNDVSWVPEYADDYLIYDRSENSVLPDTIDEKKIIRSKNIGFNLYDYFTFIIDNYDNLPDRVIFVKGNVFPRHVSREFFDRIANSNFFTPIEDYKTFKTYWPVCFVSSDGGFCEINNSWYTKHYATKYFRTYNDFISFCFKNPPIPRYVRFAPGANYIVPKENILKFPRVFYENLKMFISHCPLPGEAHIIERALYTLWTCNFELNEKMLVQLKENIQMQSTHKNRYSLLKRFFFRLIRHING